jgi:hypothetical protein
LSASPPSATTASIGSWAKIASSHLCRYVAMRVSSAFFDAVPNTL